MATVTPTLEFHNGSSWANITADTLANTLTWRGGIRGGGPTDRVAIPGILQVELKNGTNNSGGLLGYYSPDHANKRTGWVIGAKIRVKLVSGANTRYWLYRIKSIKPVPGQYGPRRVEVTAVDYMEEFSKRKISGLTIQTDKRGDELLTTLVASMPIAPTATSYGAGVFQFPYAFHNERDEETACLTVLQKISQSELSYIYTDGDATGGETLHYEPHTTRLNLITASGTLTNTMNGLEIHHGSDNIYNKIRATTYPVDIDNEIAVLGSITEEFSIGPGETVTKYIRYTDEDNTSIRISGTNIVTPEANTDYRMSSAAGNSGNDINDDLTITPVAGANTLMVTLTNGAAVWGYINLLQIRGMKVTTNEKVENVEEDSTSITAYGEKTITFNMPYQSNAAFGQAVSAEILRRYKDPLTDISGVSFDANKSTTLMGYALTLGIGSRITVTETVTGVDDGFFINGYEYELRSGTVLGVSWTLERAFNTEQYFEIDDATFGEIDGAYEIAPF
jgi:hypothetical protein